MGRGVRCVGVVWGVGGWPGVRGSGTWGLHTYVCKKEWSFLV